MNELKHLDFAELEDRLAAQEQVLRDAEQEIELARQWRDDARRDAQEIRREIHARHDQNKQALAEWNERVAELNRMAAPDA